MIDLSTITIESIRDEARQSWYMAERIGGELVNQWGDIPFIHSFDLTIPILNRGLYACLLDPYSQDDSIKENAKKNNQPMAEQFISATASNRSELTVLRDCRFFHFSTVAYLNRLFESRELPGVTTVLFNGSYHPHLIIPTEYFSIIEGINIPEIRDLPTKILCEYDNLEHAYKMNGRSRTLGELYSSFPDQIYRLGISFHPPGFNTPVQVLPTHMLPIFNVYVGNCSTNSLVREYDDPIEAIVAVESAYYRSKGKLC